MRKTNYINDQMKKCDGNKIGSKTILLYFLLFIIMTAAVYAYFILSGRSFIWREDGYDQHYVILAYFSEMIRNFLQDPSAGFPLWVSHSGLGANLIADFAYYIDPFDYLAIFVPRGYLPYAFNFLAVLRLCAAGLAFLLLASKLKIRSSGALFGAMVYVFSMFPIYVSTRHPFFIDGLIILPLLFFAIEKMLRRESFWWLILFSWLSAITNFYFLYMALAFSGAYFLVRFFTQFGWRGQLRFFLNRFGVLIGGCAAGMMLAGPVLFPTVWGFLHSSRTGIPFADGMLVFPLSYYLALPRIFLTGENYSWNIMGYASVALFVFPFLISRRRQYKSDLLMLLIFMLVMLSPVLSAVMNGFTVPSNRWTFGFNLIIALALARIVADRASLSRNERLWFLITVIIYIPMAFLGGGLETFSVIALSIVIDIFFALVGWLLLFPVSQTRHPWLGRGVYALLMFSTCLNLIVGANMHFANLSPHLNGWTLQTLAHGFQTDASYGQNFSHPLKASGKNWYKNRDVEQHIANTYGGAEKMIKHLDSGIYRIGHPSRLTGAETARNTSMLLNFYTTDYYWSIINGDVANLSRALENRQFVINKPLEALDDRFELNQFLGVKYIVSDQKNDRFIPSGYTPFTHIGAYTVFRSQLALPFAYLQTRYRDEQDFRQDQSVQKGLDLINAAVVDKKKAGDLKTASSGLRSHQVIFTMKANEGIRLTRHQIKASRKAPIHLFLNTNQLHRGDELYVRITGLRRTDLSQQTKRQLIRQGVIRKSTAFDLEARFQGVRKINKQKDILNFSGYDARKDMTTNLGSYRTADRHIELIFGSPGTYTYDRIQVLAVPYDRAYRTQIHKLQKNPLHITSYKDGYLSGRIRNKQTGILVTQLPYSSGWSATVDGRPMQTLRVDQAFVGLKLSAGDHRIILRYWTPWLTAGLIAMMFTAAGLVALAVVSRKKKGGTQH